MRAALYARVSTDTQDTDNQLLRLRAWAEAKGWTVHQEYVDVASGANMHRPALDDMLIGARRGDFDIIAAVKIDRIARSLINLQHVVQTIDAAGVRLVMLDQDIDTQTAAGRLMFNLLGSFAEFERELIRERTRDGLARAHDQGRDGGRPRRKLSDYQKKKAQQILAEKPGISLSELARQFDGISKPVLIKLLREEGLI